MILVAAASVVPYYCMTCGPAYGYPCPTVRALASTWAAHEGYAALLAAL